MGKGNARLTKNKASQRQSLPTTLPGQTGHSHGWHPSPDPNLSHVIAAWATGHEFVETFHHRHARHTHH